jgi:hypothetical protein
MRERQTTRYATALDELDRYAEFHRFEGISSFYHWERLKILANRLRALYDAFELEGDLGPVRDEVDGYQRDLWRHHIKPDQGVNARLQELLAGLEAEQAPRIDVLVSTVPMVQTADWPEHLLTVRPDELQALLEARASTQGPNPAA